MISQKEEVELIGRANAGDVAARELLFFQFERMLWGFASKVQCAWLEKEDLFQIACLEFLTSLDKFNPDFCCRLSTFLYAHIPKKLWNAAAESGIVRTPSTAIRRKSSKERAMAANSVTDFYCDLATNEREQDFLETEKLKREISKLTSKMRFVIAKRMDGVGCPEIAKEMKVTRQAVDAIEKRAFAKIREAFTPELNEPLTSPPSPA